MSSLGMRRESRILSFSLPLRLVRAEPPLVVTPFFAGCGSSRGSSNSSFFARLFLPLLWLVLREGRAVLSLDLGLGSDGGEPAGDLLEEGAGRRPERRGSFGDGGGPMVATLAIADVGRCGKEVRGWSRGKIQTMPPIPRPPQFRLPFSADKSTLGQKFDNYSRYARLFRSPRHRSPRPRQSYLLISLACP